MPELDFRGKEFVRNHHLTVPFRPLLPDAAKSIGDGGLDGSLIIHGDNLHALKALLPRYSGKVDCIFIDPPYNTGNEGWSYNDNVNSPLMKEWLSSNPINSEDLLRHDKWCCMMWPRLKLLWELLSDSGLLWISIDDKEVHRLRAMLDEILGEEHLIAQFVWKSRQNKDNRNQDGVSIDHEYLLAYGKALAGEIRSGAGYSNPDGDQRGAWASGNMVGLASIESRPNLHYCFKDPATGRWYGCPKKGWRYEWKRMRSLIEEDRILWPAAPSGRPREKVFLENMSEETNVSTVISTGPFSQDGTKEVTRIFGKHTFDFPKPTALIEWLIEQSAGPDDLILDSFAGTGTTAHAVLSLNAGDNGNRRFILIECEDYADAVTAARVRRVVNGYPFTGTQRETLFERKITWTEVKKGDALRADALNTKTLFGDKFDAVKIEVKDGTLRVVGERNIAETAPGLGGSFTYCTLGDAIDLDKMLSGESLPARAAMAEWLLYVAGVRLTDAPVPETDDAALREWYLGRDEDVCYWLVYRPDKPFLLSREAALTLDMARRLKQFDRQRKHLVFAPAKYVSRKLLVDEKLPVEYANIPFSLFRLERD